MAFEVITRIITMNNQHLDYDVLNALKDIMEDDFIFLINTFIQDSTERVSQLQLMVNTAGAEADVIRRAAHSFKGSCSNIGAPYLTGLCSSVEAKVLNGNFGGLSTDVNLIEQEFSTVKMLLTEYFG